MHSLQSKLTEKGKRQGHRTCTNSHHAIPLILRAQKTCQQSHPIAREQGHHHMRGSEKDSIEILALSIRRRVEQDHEDDGKTEEDATQPNEPCLFPTSNFFPDNQWQKPHKGHHGGEFGAQSFEIKGHLLDESQNRAGWVCTLILPTTEGVNKAIPGARIAPIHRGIGGRSQRHVKIKTGAY